MSESDDSQIISFASHPPPTDSVLVFSLSRDCTLRVWNLGTCVASYAVKHAARTSLSPTPRGETPTGQLRSPLLSSEPRTLIRILPASGDDLNVDDNIRILVFMPTPASFESGGWFYLFRISPNRAASKDIHQIGSIPCSPKTAGAELRDFMVYNSCLYTLWDQTGRPIVEYTHFDPEVQDETDQSWRSATYPFEAELTPDHLDELLLRSGGGSLVDTFMSAILRPGVFSPFTIETALQQYTDSLLSIPGPQLGPLRRSYLTISEHIAAVVGCTVNVTVDPRTGVPQRAKYWNALKRDWEGFIARCRGIERSGRWPLSLGFDAKQETVLILERERAGVVASEDEPLSVQRGLGEHHVAGEYSILQVGAALKHRLSSSEVHACETHFETMVSQERGYSYAETLNHCVTSLEAPRFDLTHLVLHQLEGINDLSVEFERALDIISTLPAEVKLEDPDEQIVPQATRWSRGVVTAYIHASVEARYELCLTLVVLLFHLDTRRRDLLPALLTRIFATFRNTIILRFLAWQPAGDPDGTQTMSPDTAVLRRLQNMAVSSQGPASRIPALEVPPTYSLVYRMMQESNSVEVPLPGASFTHLRVIGLFESRDASEVTMLEVALCKWLVDLGFRDAALEVIGRLPRSPGISYVHGMVLVQIGRADDGASLLQRVGANFGE